MSFASPEPLSAAAGTLRAAMIAVALDLLGSGCATASASQRSASPLGSLVVRSGTETSIYTDSDSVTVATPTISGSVENPLSGWSFGGRYLVDVVTAASADIVATATPRWREVRHAISGDAGYKSGDVGGAAHASASIEPDYRALSIGATGAWELYQKNVTLLFGYGYANDTAGRVTTPFDVFSQTVERQTVNAGASIVAGPATLVTVVADAIIERGDQSKPYRYVPMFLPRTASGIPAGASFELVNSRREHERPLERLPLSRERFALTGRFAHIFSASTLRLEERLYFDTWGLMASTTDAQFIFDLTKRISLAPHVRAHTQGGVSFWRRAYELAPDTEGRLSPPGIRTGDRELGPLRSLTGGLGFQCDLSMPAGARAWVLTLQTDGVLTSYSDALYIERRNAYFVAVSLDATFE